MAQFEDNPQDRWAKPRRTTDDQFDFEEVDNLLSRDYVQNNKIQLVRNITPSGVSSQTVKITDGTDITLVNPDGTLSVSDKTKTPISGTANITTNTTTVLITAGAGKTFYLAGINHCGAGGSTDAALLSYRNNTTAFCNAAVAASAQCGNGCISGLSPLTAVAAGQNLDVVTTSISGGGVRVSWWGWEE